MSIRWPRPFEKEIKKPKVPLQDEVEFDEVSVVAGHKGNPVAVRTKGREGEIAEKALVVAVCA
ncbi:MAG: hypothetical protein ACE5FU_08930 [Nitrospinota bacterium]